MAVSLPSLGLYSLGLYCLYYIAHTFYNLFFHPLRKFPGPWLCTISRLPITKRLLQGTEIFWLRDLHEKYGHVVRVAPDQLSYTDERAWGDIGGSTPAAKYGMAKDERLNDLVGGDTLNPDPNKSKGEQKHTQMRRAFAPGLTKAALRQQDPLIQKHVDEFVDEVRMRGSSGQKPLNIVEMFNFLAYDIFSDLFLGDPFNLFKDTTYVPWVHSIKGFAKATISMGALQHFIIARYALAFIIQKFGKKYRDPFMNVCFERFDRRAATKQSTHPDLFYFATANRKKGEQQLPLKDMRDFSPFLMLAGGETTPTLLSGLTFYLLTHPAAFTRVLGEVRDTFHNADEMTMETLLRLPYLGACIEETLRLYPPVAAGVERIVPPGGAPIAGSFIPGGTIVLIAQYATHHQQRNFARAHDWIPERWLPDAGAEFSGDHKTALRPFSVGPHSCFGQDLAHYVIRLSMCKLLLHYDLTLHPDSENWMANQKAYFSWMKPELKIYLTPRQY